MSNQRRRQPAAPAATSSLDRPEDRVRRERCMRQVVRTDQAPLPAGPYSQAVIAGDFVYVAGQAPTDRATGKKVEGGVKAEPEQVLKNVQAILEAAGTSRENLVKV